MKTKIVTLVLFVFSGILVAQSQTFVNATSSEISDNFDLRAVASIFGDSANLEDFEHRLNDPKLQISNLDLNNDNQVDYLRVIESVEGRTHVVIIQAVLRQDVYQDVATIEIERNRDNVVNVQIVGNPYFYGANYIYEPIYVQTPVFYNYFWVDTYRPYYSPWNWGYYPTYYVGWNPYPIFRYRRRMTGCININYQYNYVNYRRSEVAVRMYNTRRNDYYERENPNRSFGIRHAEVRNRYELDRTRPEITRDVSNPRDNAPRDNSVRNTTGVPRTGDMPRNNSNTNPRGNNQNGISPRPVVPNRSSNDISTPRQEPTRVNESAPSSPRPVQNNPMPRESSPRQSAPRQSMPQNNQAPRSQQAPRSAPRNEGGRENNGGGRR